MLIWKLISSTEEKGVGNSFGAGKSFKLNRGRLVIKCPNKAHFKHRRSGSIPRQSCIDEGLE